MNNKIHDALLQIKAEEELKERTASFLSQAISKRSKKASFNMRRSFATALAVLMMSFGVGGYSVWATPVSYISVDVNPSVELSLNRWDRVIVATGYGQDGEDVLDGVSLKWKTYEKAIDTLMYSESMRRYLAADSLLSFTVVSDKKEELLNGIRRCNSYQQYGGTSGSVDPSIMKEAHENKVSFGKYTVYLLLSEFDTTKTFEDYRGFTMRQLHDMLESLENGETKDGTAPGSGLGPGNGYQRDHKGNSML
ncbi:MAG: hypothetical protein EOM59_07305 [Clostridia bacterium]|nr:hypothetical protein [Clostridia bacterium]